MGDTGQVLHWGPESKPTIRSTKTVLPVKALHDDQHDGVDGGDCLWSIFG